MKTTNQNITALVAIAIICTAQIFSAFGLLISLDMDTAGIVTGRAIGITVVLLMIALCLCFSKIVDYYEQKESVAK